MNITSQFFLTYYAGQESLSLTSMPAELSVDKQKAAQYNRFIDSISTIYGSQTPSGTIPVFWTVSSGLRYMGSTESTLLSLEPRSSYYFILRDETFVPCTIPMVGGIIDGFDIDSDTLPEISCSGVEILDKSTQNYTYLEFKISGLLPYQEYSYHINGVAANWPTMVTPTYGTIKPSTSQYSLDSVLTFCKSSGQCVSDSHLLNYTLDSHGINFDNLYSIINLEITPTSYVGTTVISNNVGIQCKNCLPNLSVELPSVAILTPDNYLTNPCPTGNEMCDPMGPSMPAKIIDNRFYTFKASIYGLEPNKNYNYVFRSIDANWPAKLLTPFSGTIKSSNNNYLLQTTLAFCIDSCGECPPGTKGLLENYTIGSKYDMSNLFTALDLSVTKEDNSEQATSNTLTIYCQGCLS